MARLIPPPAQRARASSAGGAPTGGSLLVRWSCAPGGSALPDRALSEGARVGEWVVGSFGAPASSTVPDRS
eukprot:15448516-Alexandrium_andersonii.AAC.1